MAETIDNLVLRRRYAELLRQFMSGRMTNYEYDDRADDFIFHSRADDALDRVYEVAWLTYCDIRKHRMTDPDRRLPKAARRCVARWIVFLRSGAPICPDATQLILAKPSRPVEYHASNRTLIFAGLSACVLLTGLFAANGVSVMLGVLASALAIAIAVGAGRLMRVNIDRHWINAPARLVPDREQTAAFDPNSLWPFASQSEYELALRTAGYFGCSQPPQISISI